MASPSPSTSKITSTWPSLNTSELNMHILKKIIPGVLCSVLAAVAHAQQVRKGGTVPQEAESSSYKLRAGDSVEIRVFKHDELSVRGPIGADGTVSLTFLDSITIAGLTPSQARARSEAMLSLAGFASFVRLKKAAWTIWSSCTRAAPASPGLW